MFDSRLALGFDSLGSHPAPPSELPCGSLSRPSQVSIHPTGYLRQSPAQVPSCLGHKLYRLGEVGTGSLAHDVNPLDNKQMMQPIFDQKCRKN